MTPAEFASPEEAEEYAKAYAKAAAKLNRRTRIFGDAEWWQHPEREWTEGAYWSGGAESWSAGGSRPGRPFGGFGGGTGRGMRGPAPHGGVGNYGGFVGAGWSQ